MPSCFFVSSWFVTRGAGAIPRTRRKPAARCRGFSFVPSVTFVPYPTYLTYLTYPTYPPSL